MDDPSLANILSGGGAVALAVVVWKTQLGIQAAIEKLKDSFTAEMKEQTEMLSKMVERLARIDERTFGAVGRARLKTSPIGVRSKPQTPFTADDGDGK
jgi:hypothetical protein